MIPSRETCPSIPVFPAIAWQRRIMARSTGIEISALPGRPGKFPFQHIRHQAVVACRAIVGCQLDVDPQLAEFLFPAQQPSRRRAEQHCHFRRVRPPISYRLLCQGEKGRHPDPTRDHDRRPSRAYRLKCPSQRTEHIDPFSFAPRGEDLGSAADDPVYESENAFFRIAFRNAEGAPEQGCVTEPGLPAAVLRDVGSDQVYEMTGLGVA